MNSKITRAINKLWVKWLDLCIWCTLKKVEFKITKGDK